VLNGVVNAVGGVAIVLVSFTANNIITSFIAKDLVVEENSNNIIMTFIAKDISG